MIDTISSDMQLLEEAPEDTKLVVNFDADATTGINRRFVCVSVCEYM